jgi:hypothetical protein
MEHIETFIPLSVKLVSTSFFRKNLKNEFLILCVIYNAL